MRLGASTGDSPEGRDRCNWEETKTEDDRRWTASGAWRNVMAPASRSRDDENAAMLKGRRSEQEKRTNVMKSSSSSSSHSRRMICKCGEEVLLLKSSTKTNPRKTFWRCPNWKSSGSCNFFTGVMKKTCINLEMRRVRHGLS
ncbi:Zinc finger, GRF-type [Sesbania bispinosa]|nr:Zinc finger, GRF-type [Sesbania bispinosa]